jgi:hypothetical protein
MKKGVLSAHPLFTDARKIREDFLRTLGVDWKCPHVRKGFIAAQPRTLIGQIAVQGEPRSLVDVTSLFIFRVLVWRAGVDFCQVDRCILERQEQRP